MEKDKEVTSFRKLMWTYLVLGCLLTFQFLLSCRDDKFSSSPSDTLSFSQDTLRFDTVFTNVGSATGKVMVYNRHDDHLKISSIRLNGGVESPFRINVDGVSNTEFSDVEIFRKDSLFVFVEVTIDPNDENTPFLVRDTISFLTNTVKQQVILEAYGQNAVVLRNSTIDSETTLTPEKPYLIYGTCCVKEGVSLKISPGCRLYFHKDAGIDVYGSMEVNGTADQPVLFRGDRLDKFLKDYKYDDLPGLWNGIRFFSDGHLYVRNAIVRNGKTAILAKGTALKYASLEFENVKIMNFDSCGICAKNASLTIVTSLIADCKRHALSQVGGELNVEQTTIANYFVNLASTETRTGASVALANYDYNENYELENVPLSKADFVNCVIYGSYKDEIALRKSDDETVAFTFRFVSSLLKTEERADDANFVQVIYDAPDFVSVKFPHDYHLNSESPARDAVVTDAAVSQNYMYDLDGNNRLQDGKPDLGAYEYQLNTDEEE